MSLYGVRNTYGGGNYSWAGPGTDFTKAESGTLVADEFDANIVPSGTPVFRDAEGYLHPWEGQNPAALRFNAHDQSVAEGDKPVVVLWQGNIKVHELPVDSFAPPAGSPFVFDGALPGEGE